MDIGKRTGNEYTIIAPVEKEFPEDEPERVVVPKPNEKEEENELVTV